MALSTRQGLIDYCLRRLGHPVIEINVDEDQIDDRIDEALQYFAQYHYCLLYTSPSPRDQRGARIPGWG